MKTLVLLGAGLGRGGGRTVWNARNVSLLASKERQGGERSAAPALERLFCEELVCLFLTAALPPTDSHSLTVSRP